MIDRHAPDWPRQQVARILRERIAAGEFTTGQLPSYMQLSEEVGVAPRTVQQALKILKAEGLVYGVPGRGTFLTGR